MATTRRIRPRPVSDKHEGTITVMSSGFGVEQEDRQEIEVEPFASEPAYVRVGIGITKALDVKFEFLRIDVAVTMPCYPSEVSEVSARLSDEAYRILVEEQERWGIK